MSQYGTDRQTGHIMWLIRMKKKKISHRPIAWELIPFSALWAGEG